MTYKMQACTVVKQRSSRNGTNATWDSSARTDYKRGLWQKTQAGGCCKAVTSSSIATMMNIHPQY